MLHNLDLSIVILTHNRKDMLIKCLSSLYQNTRDISYEVILVDNASNDDTIKAVQENFACVKIIKNSRNLGVGPARNQGLSIAKGRYYLLLDDDTEIIDSSLEKLIVFMDIHPQVYICGPKLISPSGEPQFSCRRDSSPLTAILRRTFLSKLFKNSKILRNYLMLDFDHKTVREVDWVQGACLLMRTSVVKELGMLKSWFHGPEDQEICWRVRKNGWKVGYFPYATVVHNYTRTSAKGINKFTVVQIAETLHFFLLRFCDNIQNILGLRFKK